MAGQAAIKQRVIDWIPVREAFSVRSPLPSYTELSAEFGIPISSVCRTSNEEGWPDLRLARMEQSLKAAGATELILTALKGEEKMIQQSRLTCAAAITAADLIIESITANTDSSKDSTRAQTLNNVCFALANLGRFIESLGIVGMPGGMRDAKKAGQSENGQPWEKGMLQQINVTVKNIQAEAGKLSAAEKAEPVSVDPASSSGPAGGF